MEGERLQLWGCGGGTEEGRMKGEREALWGLKEDFIPDLSFGGDEWRGWRDGRDGSGLGGACSFQTVTA